jgi:hypothetical protein
MWDILLISGPCVGPEDHFRSGPLSLPGYWSGKYFSEPVRTRWKFAVSRLIGLAYRGFFDRHKTKRFANKLFFHELAAQHAALNAVDRATWLNRSCDRRQSVTT